MSLVPLAKKICRDCPQRKIAGLNQVPTEHYGDVDVMLIGDFPDAFENQRQTPFVSRANMVARRIVQQLNQGEDDHVAYGNVVRCRPVKIVGGEQRSRPATPAEIKCCRKNIWRDIERLDPKCIVLCSDAAVNALALNLDGTVVTPQQKFMSLRGRDFVVRVNDRDYPAIVTYNADSVLRVPSCTSVFRDDIAKAFRRTRGEIGNFGSRGKKTKLLTTVQEVKSLINKMLHGLTKKDIVAFDYESDSLLRLNNRILCTSFAFSADQAYVIPMGHAESPFSPREEQKINRLLKEFFATQNPSFKSLVAHNALFECNATVDRFGTHIMMPIEDTRQRAHVLNEDRKDVLPEPYGLKALVEECLGFYHYADPDIRPTVALRNQGRLVEANLDALAEYNGIDSYVTWRLYRWQQQWAKADQYKGFNRLSLKLQGRVARMLAAMERNGIRANRTQLISLASNDSALVTRQNALLKELYRMPNVLEANKRLAVKKKIPTKSLWGGKKNTGAPFVFQIGEKDSQRCLFFDVLELAPVKFSKKTKTPSVGKELYSKYEDVPEIKVFSEYMGLQKIRTTYIDSVLKFLQKDPDMRDQRVRPHFNPTGTITGRLSSSNPNMLNVPSRSKDEAAKAIKRLYIVDPGNVMVCADYSQAEVRWLAEMSQDPDLIQAFRSAYDAKLECRVNPTEENKRKSKMYGDVHSQTAAMIEGISLEKFFAQPKDVAKSLRTKAKETVFGLVYGMSTHGLAARLKISKKEASEVVDKFFSRLSTVKQWLDSAETTGYYAGSVVSPFGRRKIISSNLIFGNEDPNQYPDHLRYLNGHRNYEMRVCRNAPIQGVASDTTLLACCCLLDYVLKHELDWRLVNTVYDSIMLEVPFPDVQHCAEITQTIMESPELFKPFGIQPKVPFVSDVSVGISWGDQLDIAYDEEVWEVRCRECGKVRIEDSRPRNRRCEECGSRDVYRGLVAGSLDAVVQQIDRDHKLSEYWA